MKGIKIEERINIYSRLVSGKVYTNKDLTDIALKHYPDRSAGVISTHMGSDMVADGMLYRVSRSQYVRNDLYTANRIPDELREILEQAPIWWTIGALFDYFDRNVSIDEIRRDWEQYKASQDANE